MLKKSLVAFTPFIILNSAFIIVFSSCSIQKKISHSAKQVITDSALQTAHIGISIYEPGSGKYWYNYNGEKYFVPASNTKIPTCYAAMKYLGDSLVGLRYSTMILGSESAFVVKPSGDPSFLHPDFKNQPVQSFLKKISGAIIFDFPEQEFDAIGSGWSWNDYKEPYMVERSMFPMYGNLVKFIAKGTNRYAIPKYFIEKIKTSYNNSKSVQKPWGENTFSIDTSIISGEFAIPFVTDDTTIISLLNDTIPAKWYYGKIRSSVGDNKIDSAAGHKEPDFQVIYSQPTDSLLKPMMHRSDNFFAEQSLLMVSNERLGVMNDEKIIDTLLKTDFKDLPQKPRWVDGCGLSRYNLFTPQDFVFILKKIKDEFGMERIKNILPTGGEGTLSSYYKADKGYIYAKTGSLSGVLCLSGYLYTKGNKLLIFSVLVNNYRSAPSDVRKAIEKFLEGIRNSF
ncbi:MAG: D-alanyl-D-alanine carboxypeptidase [Chitinophagaceae bacterium]